MAGGGGDVSARRPNFDALAKGLGGMLKTAVHTARRPDGLRQIRWQVVKERFRVSRGEAIALCRSVGEDPFVWVP